MYELKDETNIREIVKQISAINKISESSIKELLIYNSTIELANKLNIFPADLDCVLNGEPNLKVAELFGFTQADLDNLMCEYGRVIVLGMLIGYLTNNKL